MRDDTNHVDQLKLFPSCAVIILFICIFFFLASSSYANVFPGNYGQIVRYKRKKSLQIRFYLFGEL